MIRALAVALLMLATAPAMAQEAPLSPGPHKLAVADVNLWYRVAGKTDGVPLVFLHGGPGEGSQAFQTIGGPELEKARRIVYLDQRGSGRSDRPKGESFYSIEILVEDIERLRRHLGVEKIALLGHSFGTILALEYASRYPGHVSAVVLAGAVPDLPRAIDIQCGRLAAADSVAYVRARQGLPADAYPRCNIFAAYEGDAMKAHIQRNMFPDPAIGALVDRLDSQDRLANTGELSGALFAQGLASYRFAAPGKVTAPVLVIAGGKDLQAVIEPQRSLAEALPNARLIEYPANGHFMFVEDPARFARDVSRFLDRR